jgi:tRNA modification GTPase
MMNQDTIVALATSPSGGAISIIRLSGEKAIDITAKVYKGKDLSTLESHTVAYGHIVDNNEIVDEVMIAVFRSPRTFTTEDSVEISCHASTYIIEQIINLLIRHGSRLATAGEFTMRAFLNGRIDLTQAEAVADLIAAENKASHDIALNQLRGGFSSELKLLREELIQFAALIELELDFSEEDVEFANREKLLSLIEKLKRHVSDLISSFEFGNAIKNGVPVAIVGKPNAGKSSLLNTLLNEERAIVSEIAGTTRDVIEETINIEGVKFRFIDTAGMRDTLDTIEAIGVQRAKDKVNQAKIIIHLYEEDTEILEELQESLFDKIVFNLQTKIDIRPLSEKQLIDLKEKYPDYISFGISTTTKENIEQLKHQLVAAIKGSHNEHQIVITNERHKQALSLTLISLVEAEEGLKTGLYNDLVAFHLKDCLKHLGSITGQIETDRDILGAIFGKFCIGK